MNLSIKKISLVLGLIFFVLGTLTLPHYGINWDTINHLPRGQAYLNYFLTGKKDFSNLHQWKDYWQDPDSLFIKSNTPKQDIVRRSLYQSDGTTFNWFMQHDGNGHPPLSDILTSFFNKILFQDLGLINDIDSYRIYSILLASLLVALVFFWTTKVAKSKFAGIMAALALFLYPLFWSESHFNNEKDIPETVFWSFLMFFIWMAVSQKKKKWFILSGVLFGLCLGTKFNAFFAPVVIAPWAITVFFSNIPKKIKKKYFLSWFKVGLGVIFIGLIGIGIFIGTWPYLWADPISRIEGVLKFYKNIGITSNIDPRFTSVFGINTYPITWITFTTPLVTLLFFIIGFIFCFSKIKETKDKVYFLFLLWLIIPIIRVTLPKTNIYGGIRQIMEYIPALAIISGLGANKLKEIINKKIKLAPEQIMAIILILFFIPITIKLVHIHPNENAYFNPLIGGLKGAMEEKIPSWGNTFGAAYRQGISWIDKNAEKNASVVLAYELLPNIPRIWIRNDLVFHNSNRSGYLRRGEYAITLIYDGVIDRSYYDSYLEKFEKPVYETNVDGISLLKVWKNSDDNLYKPWKEEVIKNLKVSTNRDGVLIDINESVNLSKLEISYSDKKCEPLKNGLVQISQNNKVWQTLPGVLPNSWRISYLKEQPKDGNFIEPFVGQSARYIKLLLTPENTCLKNIQSIKLYKLL